MPKPRLPTIRASEIGEYVYCSRSWWYRRSCGLEPEGHERREHGTTLHRRHGQAVASSQVLLGLAGLLLAIGVILLLGAALLR